ncbi:hypothetical protein BDZ89DRAFT_1135260 [Hymenopellis radicata]|nr:hypothetical protein BDZ89DRAFT_1135260 [Hymenopellis radicata]
MAPSILIFNGIHKLPVAGLIPAPPKSGLYDLVAIDGHISTHPGWLSTRIHKTDDRIREVAYNVDFLDSIRVDPSSLLQPSLESQDHWFVKYGSGVSSSVGSRLDDLKGERPMPLVEVEKDVFRIDRSIAYELINELETVKKTFKEVVHSPEFAPRKLPYILSSAALLEDRMTRNAAVNTMNLAKITYNDMLAVIKGWWCQVGEERWKSSLSAESLSAMAKISIQTRQCRGAIFDFAELSHRPAVRNLLRHNIPFSFRDYGSELSGPRRSYLRIDPEILAYVHGCYEARGRVVPLQSLTLFDDKQVLDVIQSHNEYFLPVRQELRHRYPDAIPSGFSCVVRVHEDWRDIVLSPRLYSIANWLFLRTQEIGPGCRIIRWHMDVQLTYGQAPKPVLRAFQRALAAAREDGTYKDVIRLPETYLPSHGPTPSIQEVSEFYFPCVEIVNDRGLPATWEAPVWPIPRTDNVVVSKDPRPRNKPDTDETLKQSGIHWFDDIPTLEYPSSDDELPVESGSGQPARTLEAGPSRTAASISRPVPYRKGGFRKTSGKQPKVCEICTILYAPGLSWDHLSEAPIKCRCPKFTAEVNSETANLE